MRKRERERGERKSDVAAAVSKPLKKEELDLRPRGPRADVPARGSSGQGDSRPWPFWKKCLFWCVFVVVAVVQVGLSATTTQF